MHTLIILIVAAAFVLMLPASAVRTMASAAPRLVRLADTPIEYAVGLRSARTQMVDITMRIRGARAGELELALPVWRPGKYQVLDSAGGVRDVAARTGDGRELPITKKDKSSWLVQIPSSADEVLVSYRVYANSVADRTRHADDTHAFLSPSTVFMYAPSMRSAPLSVRIDAPDSWRVATGLEQDREDASLFIAPNYDVLVDSPFEIGEHEVLTFEVEGIPHEIVIWNPTTQKRTLDDKRITGDFEKIVREQLKVFGSLPYRRYVFLIHCYPAGSGGTEHLNSTIMGCKPEALRDGEAFKKFLGLVSHEFFHTWNVKQFRPAGIHPYDYQRENYTNLLWVAEGTTSYYDDLTLARAGIIRPDEYLKTISGTIDSIRRRPGAKVQSLSESSYDAWIKFNKTTPDSANSTVSFYDKGALVSLLLDLQIRRASRGRYTLDDLMCHMDREFPLDGPGYTHDQVVAIAERLAGGDLDGFFARFVDGTADLPFEELIGVVGLELRQGDSDKQQEPKPYLGLAIDAAGVVTAAASDGPAYAAGLIASDSIVAANDQRIRSQGDLDSVVNSLKPGDEVRLTYFRYDTLRNAVLLLGSHVSGKWTLRRVEEPTEDQKAAYRSWLGQDWPAK